MRHDHAVTDGENRRDVRDEFLARREGTGGDADHSTPRHPRSRPIPVDDDVVNSERLFAQEGLAALEPLQGLGEITLSAVGNQGIRVLGDRDIVGKQSAKIVVPGGQIRDDPVILTHQRLDVITQRLRTRFLHPRSITQPRLCNLGGMAAEDDVDSDPRLSSPVTAGDLDTATLLSLAGSLANRAVVTALAAQGYHITRAHGFIFQRLLTGDQTVTALAADLSITQQGASKHVSELERLGLVTRRVAPDDRRARRVALTDEGREVIRSARRARLEFEEHLHSLVGAEMLATTRRALARLLDEAGTSSHIADRSIPWEG